MNFLLYYMEQAVGANDISKWVESVQKPFHLPHLTRTENLHKKMQTKTPELETMVDKHMYEHTDWDGKLPFHGKSHNLMVTPSQWMPPYLVGTQHHCNGCWWLPIFDAPDFPWSLKENENFLFSYAHGNPKRSLYTFDSDSYPICIDIDNGTSCCISKDHSHLPICIQ